MKSRYDMATSAVIHEVSGGCLSVTRGSLISISTYHGDTGYVNKGVFPSKISTLLSRCNLYWNNSYSG